MSVGQCGTSSVHSCEHSLPFPLNDLSPAKSGRSHTRSDTKISESNSVPIHHQQSWSPASLEVPKRLLSYFFNLFIALHSFERLSHGRPSISPQAAVLSRRRIKQRPCVERPSLSSPALPHELPFASLSKP